MGAIVVRAWYLGSILDQGEGCNCGHSSLTGPVGWADEFELIGLDGRPPKRLFFYSYLESKNNFLRDVDNKVYNNLLKPNLF